MPRVVTDCAVLRDRSGSDSSVLNVELRKGNFQMHFVDSELKVVHSL